MERRAHRITTNLNEVWVNNARHHACDICQGHYMGETSAVLYNDYKRFGSTLPIIMLVTSVKGITWAICHRYQAVPTTMAVEDAHCGFLS